MVDWPAAIASGFGCTSSRCHQLCWPYRIFGCLFGSTLLVVSESVRASFCFMRSWLAHGFWFLGNAGLPTATSATFLCSSAAGLVCPTASGVAASGCYDFAVGHRSFLTSWYDLSLRLTGSLRGVHQVTAFSTSTSLTMPSFFHYWSLHCFQLRGAALWLYQCCIVCCCIGVCGFILCCIFVAASLAPPYFLAFLPRLRLFSCVRIWPCSGEASICWLPTCQLFATSCCCSLVALATATHPCHLQVGVAGSVPADIFLHCLVPSIASWHLCHL